MSPEKRTSTKVESHEAASDQELKNEKKWTRPVWRSGWTGIPNVLLKRQKDLGLTPPELNVLLQLLKHWWEADSNPYPSRKAIADCIGSTPQTVQRHITKLVEAGFVERKRRTREDGGYTSNEYTFQGLVKALKPFAEEEAEARKERAEAAQKKPRRKGGVK